MNYIKRTKTVVNRSLVSLKKNKSSELFNLRCNQLSKAIF